MHSFTITQAQIPFAQEKKKCGRGRTLLGEERIVYYSDQDRE